MTDKDQNTGNWNNGHGNAGDRNNGHGNAGNWNTGHRNTGDWNTGDGNTGHGNTGGRNTGYGNTGDWNTGDGNAGNWNTGHRNTGDWNTGDNHVGCFNTIDAETAYFFNKPAKVADWLAAYRPDWLDAPTPTTWVQSDDMADEEKAANPDHITTGGYLRINDMKAEWSKAYDNASPEDRGAVKKLPNFDAEVFLKITGLDLREPEQTITHNGRLYRLVEEE